MGNPKKKRDTVILFCDLPPLNPLHYNEERVMIGHTVVPMKRSMDGVYWCEVCGGHPEDPVHQAGYEP